MGKGISMEKKGISFVILIVTIVLLVILLGITTAMVGNSIQNSRRSAFASDLASLQDAVNVYYIQNAEFPIVSEGNKYIEYVYDNGNIRRVGAEAGHLKLELIQESQPYHHISAIAFNMSGHQNIFIH